MEDIDILEYENMVYKVISKYKNYYDLDDLYQVGMLGLKKALDHYDIEKGTKFSSFAWFYIKGEVCKYIRDDNPLKVSADIIKLNKSINKAKEVMSLKMGRDPTIDEIAIYLEIPYEELITAYESALKVESLDHDEIYNNIGFEDQALNPEMMDLKTEVQHLEKEEKEIIVGRYYEDMTQAELSQKLGISQVQVSRKEAKVLSKLKNNL